MSRSRHQRHGNLEILGYTEECMRCKEQGIKCNWYRMFKWRKRKTKPFGLKLFTGYGGEDYSHKYKIEFLAPVVDNGSKRQMLKNELKKELENIE